MFGRSLTLKVKNVIQTTLIQQVSINGWFMRQIDKKEHTQELCNLAVKVHPFSVQTFDKKYQTQEMFDGALKEESNVIGYFDKKFLNSKIIIKTVKTNPESIFYIPIEMQTKEILIEVGKKKISLLDKDGFTSDKINRGLLDLDFFKEILQHTAGAIRYIDHKNQTKSMILDVYNRSHSLCNIDPKYISDEMYLDSVKKTCGNLCYIPHKKQTQEMCNIAFKEYPNSVFNMNPIYRTTDMYMAALKKYPKDLSRIPHTDQTQELCDYSVMTKGKALIYVAQRYQTEDVIYWGFQRTHDHIKYMKPENISYLLAYEAVFWDKWEMEYVPEHYKSKIEEDLKLKIPHATLSKERRRELRIAYEQEY